MNFVLYWLIAFLPVILAKIFFVRKKNGSRSKDSMVFTEAIGLPLTFMQPVVFFISIYNLDFIGAVITLWWGPGFLTVVFLILISKLKQKKINWGNSGVYISWLCKIYYLVYVLLAFAWGMPKLIYALSAWIASDQIEKSFASLDADRTRRTFHDFWFVRIMYPAFLFIPFFYNLDFIFKVHGVLLFLLWTGGVLFVLRKKEFMNLPNDPTLLRNMIYFKKNGDN